MSLKDVYLTSGFSVYSFSFQPPTIATPLCCCPTQHLCSMCEERFASSLELLSHMALHLEVQDPEPRVESGSELGSYNPGIQVSTPECMCDTTGHGYVVTEVSDGNLQGVGDHMEGSGSLTQMSPGGNASSTDTSYGNGQSFETLCKRGSDENESTGMSHMDGQGPSALCKLGSDENVSSSTSCMDGHDPADTAKLTHDSRAFMGDSHGIVNPGLGKYNSATASGYPLPFADNMASELLQQVLNQGTPASPQRHLAGGSSTSSPFVDVESFTPDLTQGRVSGSLPYCDHTSSSRNSPKSFGHAMETITDDIKKGLDVYIVMMKEEDDEKTGEVDMPESPIPGGDGEQIGESCMPETPVPKEEVTSALESPGDTQEMPPRPGNSESFNVSTTAVPKKCEGLESTREEKVPIEFEVKNKRKRSVVRRVKRCPRDIENQDPVTEFDEINKHALAGVDHPVDNATHSKPETDYPVSKSEHYEVGMQPRARRRTRNLLPLRYRDNGTYLIDSKEPRALPYKNPGLSHVHANVKALLASISKEDTQTNRFAVAPNVVHDIETHGIIFTDDSPIQCVVCGARFDCKDALRSHMYIHRGAPEKRFKRPPVMCRECGQQYSKRSALNVHMRHHTGERPFPCQHCDKRFIKSAALKEHMRTHTGEKPYQCCFCERSFASHKSMTVHKRTHTGVKPYSCSVCGRGFSVKCNLTKHRRIHDDIRPYECPICDSKFRDSGTLKIHVRSHTGERPFPCLHCEKAFATSHSLVKHTRTHTKERPFQCPECNKAFANGHILRRHMKIHAWYSQTSCVANVIRCRSLFRIVYGQNRHVEYRRWQGLK